MYLFYFCFLASLRLCEINSVLHFSVSSVMQTRSKTTALCVIR
jgi:hypothetical protein